MNDDLDDLDRALFALPLETPPAGMRAAILRATVDAPSPGYAFDPLEIALIGSVFAVAVWLLLALATNPSLAGSAIADLRALARAFADPATILWVAAGGSVAAWFWFENGLLGGSLLRRS